MSIGRVLLLTCIGMEWVEAVIETTLGGRAAVQPSREGFCTMTNYQRLKLSYE